MIGDLQCGRGAGLLLASLLWTSLASPAAAQAPWMAAQQAAVIKQPAFKVQMVSPTGIKSSTKDSLRIGLETVSSDREQSVTELLGAKGLAIDQKSISALLKLNPALKADGSVPAGTSVTYFSPTLADGQVAPGEKASFDMSMAAKYQAGRESATARVVKQRTDLLPVTAYERSADMVTHRKLVASIEGTAVLVEANADKLTAKDLALSKYYLGRANDEAQRLSGLNEAKSVRAMSVAQLQSTVQPLEGMQYMMRTSGSPFSYRPVTVIVTPVVGAPPPEPLRVYTLPGGIVDRPELFTQSAIKEYLIALSFEKLTTPSKSQVAQGDMRVWVGPDHAYDAMAKRILQREIVRFKAVLPSAGSASAPELDFVSPIDVVRP